ncbi:MAG TPA: cupredoxin domain-containing protein [Chitinophagaceae bacterium]|nr:cupredoxin domain-containing protein [Chitinophagaceae bacterium]
MKKIFLFGAMLLFLAACTKDKSVDNTGPGSPNTVMMKGSVFSPGTLQANISATITWINDDNMVHTVTADDASFSSGDIAPGAKFTHTFSNTGTYNYHCMHHSGMTGTIIITGIR